MANPADLRSVARGASYNFIGAISRSLLGFLLVFVLARLLTTEEAGLFFLGINILMLAAILGIAGLDVGLRRFISIAHGRQDSRMAWSYFISAATIALPINLVLCASLFIFSDRIAIDILDKPALSGVLTGLTPYLMLYAMAEILLSVTQGYKHMKYWVISLDIVFNALRILIFAGLSLFGLTLYGAVYAQLLAIVVATSLAFYYFWHIMPPFPSTRPDNRIREVAAFSLPVSLARLSNSGNGILETILLGYFVLASDIAIYTVALKLSVMGSIILASLNTVFAPLISQLHAQQKMEELKNIFTAVTRWAFTLSFPVYFLIAWFSTPIAALFGEEYISGNWVIVALCLGQMVNAATGPSGNLLLMSGHTYTNLWINVAGVLLTIALNLVLIPDYGILGCAVAVGLAVTATNITRVVFAYRFMGMHPFEWYLCKPLAVGIACLAVLAMLGPDRDGQIGALNLLGLMAGGTLTYGLGLMALGISESDRALFAALKQRFRRS